MRRGELVNLEWSDIDFQNRIIKIQVKDFWAPKGRRSRIVPMDETTYSILLKRQNLNENKRWIFTRKNGKKLDGHLTDKIYKYAKKVGIENCNIHTFRHTFTSWLVQRGVPLYTVSKLLGHADYETTQIYANLIPDTFTDAVKKLTE
ncbi:hypothetical protein DRQ09_02365 [candidate division KSB1 bacterium]|nr:MAG: hypothetical protein DRQ09_02365 [candidate division KSB1 bacterium]